MLLHASLRNGRLLAAKSLVKGTIVTLSFAAMMTSCKKDSGKSDVQATPTVQSLTEVSAPNNFNWQSDRNLTLSFTGSAQRSYNAILKITDADGNTLLQRLQKGDEDFTTVFKLATANETVTVSFGAIKKTFSVKAGKINMNLN